MALDAVLAHDGTGDLPSASPAGVPKGYKGDPADTREDAFQRMQVLTTVLSTVIHT